MEEAREDLHKVLREDEVKDAALLVLANKQDLPSAMTTAEVTEALGLHELNSGARQWCASLFLIAGHVDRSAESSLCFFCSSAIDVVLTDAPLLGTFRPRVP